MKLLCLSAVFALCAVHVRANDPVRPRLNGTGGMPMPDLNSLSTRGPSGGGSGPVTRRPRPPIGGRPVRPTAAPAWNFTLTCNCTYDAAGTKFCHNQRCDAISVANRHLNAMKRVNTTFTLMERRGSAVAGLGEPFGNICEDFRRSALDYIVDEFQDWTPACVAAGTTVDAMACGMAPAGADVGLLQKAYINSVIQKYYAYLKCDPAQAPALFTEDVKYCRQADFCNEDIRLPAVAVAKSAASLAASVVPLLVAGLLRFY